MTHRERFLMAINHEEPDRVPIDIWFTPEAEKQLLRHLGQDKKRAALIEEFSASHGTSGSGVLPHLLDFDFQMAWHGPATGFYASSEPEYYDEWGIKWKWVDAGGGTRYTEIAEHRLADMREPTDFEMPDFSNESRYDGTREIIRKYGKDYAIIGAMTCTFFEIAWYLRGMEQLLMDMACERDWVHAYLDKLLKWAITAASKLTELGCDVIWIGDDFGTQNRMLISPEMFREFIKPNYDRLFTALRRINPNIKIALHCDGYFEPIVPDLIEIGVQIFNPIQPLSMNPTEMKRKYGKNMVLWQSLDNQHTFPFGTVQDVIDETKHRLKTCAPGGGLIIGPAHNVQSIVSVEKIMAFIDTVNKYGTYPINID
jgi:uroporphyrinogen decarboxylase